MPWKKYNPKNISTLPDVNGLEKYKDEPDIVNTWIDAWNYKYNELLMKKKQEEGPYAKLTEEEEDPAYPYAWNVINKIKGKRKSSIDRFFENRFMNRK